MSEITISVAEYKQLIKDSEKLARLEAGGVDNWDWYGESLNPDGEIPFFEYCEEVDQKYEGK